MARKQLGMVDDDLLARVDARAAELGQTRRVFTERALEAWLKDSAGDPAEVMERRILAARSTAAEALAAVPGNSASGAAASAREIAAALESQSACWPPSAAEQLAAEGGER